MEKSKEKIKRETEHAIYEVMSMIKGFNTAHSSSLDLIESNGRYFKINLEDVTDTDDSYTLRMIDFMEEGD